MLFMSISPKTKRTTTTKKENKEKKKKKQKGKGKKEVSRESPDFKNEITYNYNWPDHQLLITLHLVIIATDHR